MKEVRAIVLGLVVVLAVAMVFAFWYRPAPEFTRIKEFHVEVKEKDGDSTRRATFNIPTSLIARLVKLAHLDSIGGDISSDWGHGEISVEDILDAADRSEPGKPTLIEKDDTKIEVAVEGTTLVIDVKDDWDQNVHIRLPRAVIEGLSGDSSISTSEILHRLDALEPGDVVVIRDGEDEVTITAVPKKKLAVAAS